VRAWLSRAVRGPLIVLTLLLLLFAYVTLIEPNWLEVSRHEVRFNTLPPEFDGLVIAHLTDLHIIQYGRREHRVLTLLSEAKPDLIVITGDFLSKGSNPATIQRFLRDLQPLGTPFGVWAVLGTHEHIDWTLQGEEARRQFFADTDTTLLLNDGGRIGRGLDTLTLIGVDDPYTGHDKLGEALKGLQRTPFAILLTHSPEIFRKADLARFDLVLAGHTHGGQVRLPVIGSLWLPEGSEEYEAGWFSGVNAKMFVSRGVGTSIVPVRFLSRPEIALITLKRGIR
jgi:predicted MPP superfamily phosphohydrolase